MSEFKLNDIMLKIFHPPVQLTKRLYVDLIERLSDYYNNHSVYPDKFTFSLSRQKVATITSNMTSVSEVFDDAEEEVKSRLFKVINHIVVGAQLGHIDYFDLVVSAVYTPPNNGEDRFSFAKMDNIGKSFLKDMELQKLGAESFTTGIHLFFTRDRKSYTLKIEPFRNKPGSVFIDLLVLFPQESVSLGEIKMLVQQELDYLNREIWDFVASQMENV